MDDEVALLHALAVKGIGSPERLARATGLHADRAGELLERLAAEGMAVRRDGRVPGWTLTDAGSARHDALLDGPLAPQNRTDALALYERFAPINAAVKQVCTDWQVYNRHGVIVGVNDHTDSRYDGKVVDRLKAITVAVGHLCQEMEAGLPRVRVYRHRLSEALAAIEAGDRDRFTRPLSESYHDIWMEFHQDLLVTLRLQRTATDA